ncbi:hypothetical protein MtrunA17_Chr7g0237451 [Medicago truncatula]|uniref:DUF674 family protein n=1 Tax=Medicago truncatula TaxID=3880 RepID=A0A396H4E8_MEDTR|nr:hypothetical protein MtrunA17_Chr7g0237451 [Medicago truncatula]
MASSSATKSVDKVTLRVMVDKERNKVLYAEAGKDFIEVLFSFLTLPLGTAVKFGSISSLYQSVANLDEQYLWTRTCKEMLLRPRNSMESYCQKMKLNIDDTEPMKHFICGNWDCVRKERGNLLSIFRNQMCSCGRVMDKVFSPPPQLESLRLGSGLVKETAAFIISDDLCVMPNDFGTVIQLLQKLEISDIDAITEQTVIDILKLSLVSKTSLTDLIFKKKYSEVVNGLKDPICKIGKATSEGGRQISVKVVRRKSTGDILFAEAGDDFINFIFSFLTLPLGGVLHMLEGFSSLNSIDNLYKSLTELSSECYLILKHLKEKLISPPIAAQFGFDNQIIPIGVASSPVYYCHSYIHIGQYTRALTASNTHIVRYPAEKFVLLNLVDPKLSASNASSRGEFAKGPSVYMVTVDLAITPMSSFTAISHLNSSNVSLNDVEERVVRIGQKEGLCILKAWMNSTSGMTNGLNQFITNIKEEK